MNADVLPHSQDRFLPLLIGSGRLARHLDHYFEQKKIPHLVWNNPRSPVPRELAEAATHFWVLVSDHALAEVCARLRSESPETPILHSSAACEVKGAITVHPLMTFGPELYARDAYQKTPLTLFQEELVDAPHLPTILRSTLPNPVTIMPALDRVRYHAACVMLSNFSLILWDAAFRAGGVSETLPLSRAEPILRQTLANFISHGMDSLTGPLVRGDHETIQSHLRALGPSAESRLYRAFLEYFIETRSNLPDQTIERPTP